jgi:hypothetical protein
MKGEDFIMKRLLLMLLTMSFMISLAACSGSGNKVSVQNGVITVNGKAITVDEYTGWEAKQTLLSGATVTYSVCSSIQDCPNNMSGILYDDMTVYKGGRYFSQYLGTEIMAHFPYGDEFIECYAMQEMNQSEIEPLVQQIYESSQTLKLGTVSSVDYEGKVFLITEGYPFIVRPTEIVIPNVIRISKGVTDTNETVDFGGIMLSMRKGQNFNYYQYGEYVIQLGNAYSLESFILLK